MKELRSIIKNTPQYVNKYNSNKNNNNYDNILRQSIDLYNFMLEIQGSSKQMLNSDAVGISNLKIKKYLSKQQEYMSKLIISNENSFAHRFKLRILRAVLCFLDQKHMDTSVHYQVKVMLAFYNPKAQKDINRYKNPEGKTKELISRMIRQQLISEKPFSFQQEINDLLEAESLAVKVSEIPQKHKKEQLAGFQFQWALNNRLQLSLCRQQNFEISEL
ncbi:hypothetical protein ABPG74_019381 [Tetrahymena malaccensis]